MASAMMTQSTTTCKTGPAALIFLHGLGDTPAGWSSLEYTLPSLKKNLQQLTYVFPPAPMTAITINGGMTMPGWFDIFDWPIAVGSTDDEEGILTSVRQVEAEVEKLHQNGIPNSRIVLGGFSQGGAIALHAAYAAKNSEPYAACVCLSGWLTLPDRIKAQETSKTPPLFWGHGRFDDKVLFPQQAFGVEQLQNKGISVDSSDYGVGHSADPEEISRLADFLDEVLYGDS